MLICCVQRGEEVYIPDGGFTLRSGDKVGIVASHSELQKFFKSSGLFQKQAKSIIILGASRVAYYLAEMFLDIGVAVKIIDKDEKACELIGDALPKAVVIRGDGTQQELLMREGIAIVALAWVAISAVGAVPYVISGEIPHYVDAFFETVSGFTTTAASVVENVEALGRLEIFPLLLVFTPVFWKAK